jgi:hypothetical protein
LKFGLCAYVGVYDISCCHKEELNSSALHRHLPGTIFM